LINAMSFAGSQRQTYLRLVQALRPHWRQDLRLPERIQQLLAREKRFGSRDRRLYRELIYTTLRYLPWIEATFDSDPERAAAIVAWLAADLPATRLYRAELTAGWPDHGDDLKAKAAHLGQRPADLLPAWLAEGCPAAFTPDELTALHRRASLWLRLQTDHPAEVTEELDGRNWHWRRAPLRDDALEVLSEADVTRCTTYLDGRFEVQDLGSQLLLPMSTTAIDGAWLDACAGAGGKTLQLARLLGPEGRITAHDVRPAALAELRQRARRAGWSNIATITDVPATLFDGVLVDAPCSGSGTWRRTPHLKWVTTPTLIARHAARQIEILDRFAQCVRPGGLLIYATCSLHRSENESVVAALLEHRRDFEVMPPVNNFGYPSSPLGTALLPARHNTDGFFVASLRRR
jgi:16S rRNA (cytosine967-C5)-methyltransferase